MTKGNVAVLLSGRGSNFEAIYRFSHNPEANYAVKTVISNKSNALGLEKARKYGVPAYHISPHKYITKQEYEKRVIQILMQHDIDLVCLAGYMKIVGKELLAAFENRIINIHPALLPSFPGLHGQKQALEYGVKISGCTVHFVDSGVDTGPIILQKAVEVLPEDDEDTLSARILKEEHRIFPEAIRLYFDNKLKILQRRVIIS